MRQREYSSDSVPFKENIRGNNITKKKKSPQPFYDRGYGYEGDSSTGKQTAFKRREKHPRHIQWDVDEDDPD